MGQKSHTLPRHIGSQLQPPHQQCGIDTWRYNGVTAPSSPRSFSRSVSFPGHEEALRNRDATCVVLHAGHSGVVQQVKSEGSNALPSCVFSQAPEAGSETDVRMSGDDRDLQSWIMQALEDFPSTDQLQHSTHEQNAFDLIEEVMRGSQSVPKEIPSIRFNPGSGVVQHTRAVPSSPQQLRNSMFEERGHPVVAPPSTPPVRTESPMQYYNQQISVQQNQSYGQPGPMSYGQPGSTSVSVHQQQFVPSTSGLPVQTTVYAPPFGQQIQGQQQQPNWQLHQDSVQSIVSREMERQRQQLQGSAPGSLSTVPANRAVAQHQPQITVRPPSIGTVNQSVTFAQIGPNSGMMQSSEHSFQARNHPFKAPQARRVVSLEARHNSFSSAWPPSQSSADMLAPQPRDRSNSYHGQPSKLSVPYPTRSLTPPMRTPPMRTRGGIAVPDMSSSLGSTTPFSHFLPGSSHQQVSASPESLSHDKGSTGSLASLVSSLLYRDTAPGDTLPSPATMQNDTELEFDRMLSNPPSGFDLLSEIGNCVDDSTMDIGTTT